MTRRERDQLDAILTQFMGVMSELFKMIDTADDQFGAEDEVNTSLDETQGEERPDDKRPV